MAPPTPQRMPTGRWLSSSALPCASLVLRPSACHLDVAPTTTATCFRAELMSYSSRDDLTIRGPGGEATSSSRTRCSRGSTVNTAHPIALPTASVSSGTPVAACLGSTPRLRAWSVSSPACAHSLGQLVEHGHRRLPAHARVGDALPVARGHAGPQLLS